MMARTVNGSLRIEQANAQASGRRIESTRRAVYAKRGHSTFLEIEHPSMAVSAHGGGTYTQRLFHIAKC